MVSAREFCQLWDAAMSDEGIDRQHATIAGDWPSHESPAFPFGVHVGGKRVVELHADGTWSGDLVALRQAMQDTRGLWGDHGLLLWLLMRQLMRDEQGFW